MEYTAAKVSAFPIQLISEDKAKTIRLFLVYFAAAWSGFFLMGIEMLGGRILAPFFGTSIFVWGGILAVFMIGLSLGYLIGGYLSTKAPTLSRFGLLLCAEAFFALPIILMGDSLLEWISYTVTDARYGSLISSFLLFGISTIMSGMISPYAVRLLVNEVNKSGSKAGLLYFTSTIGSAAGTIITSFYLVLYLEINSIVASLIGASAIIGLVLIGYEKLLGSSRACEIQL